MLGSWLASDPQSYDVGEYNAFYLTHRLVPAQMRGVQPPWWEPHLERYLGELRAHAASFIDSVARSEGCDSYVDSSPRNLLIADELADRFPEALFVLVLRHYSGVVQSLGRTDWPWVPATAEGKAGVWAEAYREVSRLPAERTIVVSYDALGADPSRYVAGEQVSDLAGAVFHEFVSLSIQHLVNEIGTRMLARWPQLAEASFDAQNRTWDPGETSAADPRIKTYADPRPPYGRLGLVLRRDG